LSDRGKVMWGERIRVICLKRINFRMIYDKEVIFESFHHFSKIIRDAVGGNKEGWYSFDGMALLPCSGFPEVV